MLSQEFVSQMVDGTFLEVVTGQDRAIAAQLVKHESGVPEIVALYAGEVEKSRPVEGAAEQCDFKPWAAIKFNPKLGEEWLYVWLLYKMTWKFLHKGERELVGSKHPVVNLDSFAKARGMDKTKFIQNFDQMAEQFSRMGAYPLYRHPADDFIELPWKKREFILDNALTRDQVEAIQLNKEQYMKDVRATYN